MKKKKSVMIKKKRVYRLKCCFCKVKKKDIPTGIISSQLTEMASFYREEQKVDFPYHVGCFYLSQGGKVKATDELLDKMYRSVS